MRAAALPLSWRLQRRRPAKIAGRCDEPAELSGGFDAVKFQNPKKNNAPIFG